MQYDKQKFAEAYFALIQAGRRTEESVPEELHEEYGKLKEASTGEKLV